MNEPKIYVDPLTVFTTKGLFSGGSCHLFAAPEHREALHAFAERVGLQRRWFQEHRLCPHYDLTHSRRIAAVRLGAVELTRVEAVTLWRSWSGAKPVVLPGEKT